MIRTFYDMGKKIFAEKEKVCIFAVDFNSEINEAFTLVLCMGT